MALVRRWREECILEMNESPRKSPNKLKSSNQISSPSLWRSTTLKKLSIRLGYLCEPDGVVFIYKLEQSLRMMPDGA